MDILLVLALPINLFAICVLSFAIYFRRHRRADLMTAFIALNVGVFAVSALMLTQEVNLGFAFGLFAVLSIIRLRSDPISQREIGYYFVALALGLINGIGSAFPVAMILLNVLLLVVMYVADHPALSGRVERRLLVLDYVASDDAGLRADLEQRLRGKVLRFSVEQVSYVQETMQVDVRYRPYQTLGASVVPPVPEATTAPMPVSR